MRGRSKTFKYKNYKYSDEIQKLLSLDLTDSDLSAIKGLETILEESNKERGYKYIIKDLYILVVKYNFTSTQLAKIYSLSVRSIQVWLKELGLNRSLKDAKIIYKSKTIEEDKVLIAPRDTMPLDNKFTRNTTTSSADLPILVTDFLNYLETIKGKSLNTVIGYKIDLQLFLRFMKIYKGYSIDNNLEFEEIPINDIDENFIKNIKLTDLYAFLSFLERERNNSTYARARKVATLKSF